MRSQWTDCDEDISQYPLRLEATIDRRKDPSSTTCPDAHSWQRLLSTVRFRKTPGSTWSASLNWGHRLIATPLEPYVADMLATALMLASRHNFGVPTH